MPVQTRGLPGLGHSDVAVRHIGTALIHRGPSRLAKLIYGGEGALLDALTAFQLARLGTLHVNEVLSDLLALIDSEQGRVRPSRQ